MDRIIILDFGSQTTQLIARRIRELGVFCEIFPGETPFTDREMLNTRGIILSGSPFSVYEASAPEPDPSVYTTGLPVLGICYGFQRMTVKNNGKVDSSLKKEYGRASVSIIKESILFKSVPDGFMSWMSHGDSLEALGDGFDLIAESENHPAAAVNEKKKLYGLQFHPEVSHCDYGSEILSNFIFGICKAAKSWNMHSFLENSREQILSKVGKRKVLLLISGGVDSSVVAAMLLKILPPENIYLMYIDTGLMRKNETAEIKLYLKSLGAENIQIVSASGIFLEKLKGVSDPEKKREIIGDLFIKVQEAELPDGLSDNYFLAQGTLYTDLIESGKGVGVNAKVIKSHHNVRSPMVEAKRKAGLIIEPLDKLFKDEVRRLGTTLGLDTRIVSRHPFPGPGLAVRIIGDITEEKIQILQEADALFIKELVNRKLYNKIWQAFCVLLPVKSVGVTGDAREYGNVLALRAIKSVDGMTADVYPFEIADLLAISSKITNTIPEIGRVVYDVSSKPPSTIEWE
ncbi:MAG: glutamine-hydrolyzing GMP synthase [Spirochaetaceae bacterium]|nr:glutamine-hydrolyzing GMP synthase [Spirochaetaceae bacterium]